MAARTLTLNLTLTLTLTLTRSLALTRTPTRSPSPSPTPAPNPNPDQVNLRLLAARNEPAYFGNTLWCSYSVGDFQPCGYGFGPLQAAGAP